MNRDTGSVRTIVLLLLMAVIMSVSTGVRAEGTHSSDSERIQELEQMVELLRQEVDALKSHGTVDQPVGPRLQEAEVLLLKDAARNLNSSAGQRLLMADSWLQRFNLAGYGELHANFNQGSEEDLFDIHRLVLYLGYDFTDWIKLHAEVELEHAFVSDGEGGELVVEQAYVDFFVSRFFNFRIGRVLTPVGIVNKWHEPTTFNGVERPSFSKYILPSTWSSDGVGVFGSPHERLTYELYVVNGLDGAEFDAKNGIRGGRMHERPGLNDPAVTGRLDFYPFDSLRVGVSGYFGGLDNGNNGVDSGVDGDIRILSADFDYTFEKFDFRGAVAHTSLDDSSGLPAGVAEEMFGWYLEGAYHFWPKSFKTGLLEDSDAVCFVRFDDYDTQYEMADGDVADERYDRSEWTVGVSFKPVPNFVLKADYQFREDESSDDPGNTFNLGAGWVF